MTTDRLSGFLSAFDEMLERSRNEPEELSGELDSLALVLAPRISSRNTPRTSSEPSGNRSPAIAKDESERSARGGSDLSLPGGARWPRGWVRIDDTRP